MKVANEKSWTNSPAKEYKNFVGAPVFIPRTTAPFNNAQLPSTDPRTDASGNELIRAPKFTATVGATYHIPTSFGEVTLNGNWYHNSGFFWDVSNRLKESPYDLFNGQIEVKLDAGLALQIWGRNLTNEKYYSLQRTSSDGDQGSPAAPRTYGASVKYTF